MAARSLLVAMLASAILPLVGCIGGGDDAVQDAAGPATPTTNATCFDGCDKLVAFEETNRTEEGAGGVDHHHDMWNGAGRALMFQMKAMMSPSPDEQDRATAEFSPDAGQFVWEGTATVEFTISDPERHVCEPAVTLGGRFLCTDYTGPGTPAAPPIADPTGGPSGMKLQYKHASTVEWIDAGELKWGAPTTIKITDPRQTDMPHATSSVWRFQVVSPNAYDTTLQFTAKAEIVRGEGDVPLWPGHPLFYTPEQPARVVIDNVQAVGCEASACALADSEKVKPVAPSKLISYGTRTLFVWVNITSVNFPNPALAPNAWFVFHRNATGQDNLTNPFDFANYGVEKKNLYWALPVDDGSMDSPYADGSRWEFELGASYTSPDNPARRVSCYRGCADWAADYTIHVVASSIELSPKEYHMSCLGSEVHCPQPDEEGGASASRSFVTGPRG